MDTVIEILKTIFDVASMSTTGVIIRLALLLFGGIAFFFIKRWINKKLAEEAHRQTEERRKKEQAGLEPENRDVADDAEKGEKSIEDIIKEREQNEGKKDE